MIGVTLCDGLWLESGCGCGCGCAFLVCLPPYGPDAWWPLMTARWMSPAVQVVTEVGAEMAPWLPEMGTG